MSLDEYNRKRDFSKTPEPSGERKPRAQKSRKPTTFYFCVQKHLASQLHYDLRTRDRPGTARSQQGRSWLLIKHRDHWSGALDITTFAPLSVKSEGDFEDILASNLPDVWVTGRPGRSGAPNKMLREVMAKAAEKIASSSGTSRKRKR